MADTIDNVLIFCFYGTVLGAFMFCYYLIMEIVHGCHRVFNRPVRKYRDNSIINYIRRSGI